MVYAQVFSPKTSVKQYANQNQLLEKFYLMQLGLDYSVENIGTGTANNTRIRFKVEYTPVTNIQLGQKLWHSDIIDLYSLSPDEIASGSIVALDYEYWNGTNPVTYNSVKVYLDYLQLFPRLYSD